MYRPSDSSPLGSEFSPALAEGALRILGVLRHVAIDRRARFGPAFQGLGFQRKGERGLVSKRGWVSLLVGMLIAVAVAAPTAAAIPIVRHGPRTANVVALTFDDGWSLSRCEAILSILVRERVAATFFPISGYVKRDATFWRKVAALGFPIGNHTVHHLDMSKLPYQQQLDEIARARDAMAKVGIPMTPLFRPPYGAWNGDTLIAAEAAGYSKFMIWDTTDSDTSQLGNDTSHFHDAVRG